MSDIIKLKRSSVVGSVPTALEFGEIALNYADGVVYYKNAAGVIVEFGGGDPRLNVFLPAAPTSFAAAAGNTQAVLTWTAPSALAQIPITDYVVQSSTDGTTWTTFSDGTSTAATATVTGLTNGTAYTFRAAAVNGIGQGAFSATSSATPSAANYRPIPAMTSNSTPSGLVTVVSPYAMQWTPSILYKLFDGTAGAAGGVDNIIMMRSDNNDPLRKVQYDFGGGLTSLINGYTIQFGIGEYPANWQALNHWTFDGSNDGTTWTTLDTRTNEGNTGAWNSVGQLRSFALAAPANYSSYRWQFAGDDNPSPIPLSKLTITA